MPYYRFCQIIETIDRKLLNEQKKEIEIKEAIAKFQASIFALGSYMTKEGKSEMLSSINDFSILKKEEEKKIKEEKKLPPIGSFERLMGLFHK